MHRFPDRLTFPAMISRPTERTSPAETSAVYTYLYAIRYGSIGSTGRLVNGEIRKTVRRSDFDKFPNIEDLASVGRTQRSTERRDESNARSVSRGSR